MRNRASDRLSKEEFIPAEELFDLFELQIEEELDVDKNQVAEMKEAVKLARELYKRKPNPEHFYDEAIESDNEYLLCIAGALQTGDSSDLAI